MSRAILLIDVGNSRTKWARVEGQEWQAEGVSPHNEGEKLFAEWERFSLPQAVVACNVAGEARACAISAYWQARDVPVTWITPGPECAGVRNLYAPPERLGSDRWAAVVGAWARMRGACLVVSAGTAVTIDALDDTGDFLGGMILPGRRLMQRSLAAGTHVLTDCCGQVVGFPRNTADAMTTGIATALAASVQTAYARLAARTTQPPACLLTGGDAEWLARQLPIGVIIAPRLVLEGLLIISREDVHKWSGSSSHCCYLT